MSKSPGVVEALLFDLGGVVIEIDFELALRSWEQHSALSLDEIRARFSMDGPYEQHERGEIGAAEYFEHLRSVLELEGSVEDVVRGWNSIYVGEISQTVDDIHLAKLKLPCFAFTNSNPTHHSTWTAAYPRVAAAFDRVFVSSELGSRKPEREAFEAIAKAIGVASSTTLFFDDSVENVEGARRAGLQTVHVRTPMDVRRALDQLNS